MSNDLSNMLSCNSLGGTEENQESLSRYSQCPDGHANRELKRHTNLLAYRNY